MPDASNIDFNQADHRQRQAVRVALVALFTSERQLAMILDEELGLPVLDDVPPGPFKERVYELIKILHARGKLDDLMRAIYASDDYKEAPALHDLMVAWATVSSENGEPERRSRRSRKQPPAPDATFERILDGEVARMRPISLLAGLAALRRRVCLLHAGGTPRATGFLVGPGHVMTAAYVHYLDQAASAPLAARFDFGIEPDQNDSGVSVPLGPPVVADPPAAPSTPGDWLGSLDYALLPLARPLGDEELPGGGVRGWFDLTDKRERLRDGETVFMLHHPKGGPMMVSDGVIGPAHEAQGRLYHSGRTVPGSGGAPVVDATLRLVGLHEMAERGWGGSRGGHEGYNTAVRADWIARSLKDHGIELWKPPPKGGNR